MRDSLFDEPEADQLGSREIQVKPDRFLILALVDAAAAILTIRVMRFLLFALTCSFPIVCWMIALLIYRRVSKTGTCVLLVYYVGVTMPFLIEMPDTLKILVGLTMPLASVPTGAFLLAPPWAQDQRERPAGQRGFLVLPKNRQRRQSHEDRRPPEDSL